MLSELKEAREIAIDLEHHDEHSFIGIVSLMQISTRQKDWIVDTLKPWRHELEVLNEVFADPGIIKVGRILFQLFNFSNVLGAPWIYYGYHLVATGSWALPSRSLRHLSCFLGSRVS